MPEFGDWVAHEEVGCKSDDADKNAENTCCIDGNTHSAGHEDAVILVQNGELHKEQPESI